MDLAAGEEEVMQRRRSVWNAVARTDLSSARGCDEQFVLRYRKLADFIADGIPLFVVCRKLQNP